MAATRRAGEVTADTGSRAIRSQLAALLAARRGSIAMLVIASALSGFIEAAILALVAEIAAALVTGAHLMRLHVAGLHGHASVRALIVVAFALAIVRLLLQLPLSLLPPRIAADTQLRVRTDLFHAFSRASWEAQSRDREGELQETMTTQAMQASTAVLSATSLIGSSLNLAALLVFAFALNAIAAALVLAVAVGLFGLLRPLRWVGRRRARALSQAQIAYAGELAESIRLAQETRAFGAREAQRRRIDAAVQRAREHYLATQTLLKLLPNLYQSVMFLLIVGALAGLYELGGRRAGALGAVVLILLRASSSGQSVLSSYQGLVQALPFVERVQDAERRYLAGRAGTGEGEGGAGIKLASGIGSLVFEDVSYAYRPGRPVLRGVCFEVAAGEAIGIVGPSGAGKSTLTQLLLGLRFPVEGRYLVNGVPVDEIAGEDWHRRVAYVAQEPRLLHASVAANIRYYRDWLSDEDVRRAARLAHIHEDVVAWPEGYDTIVGPRADAVSGGQQQRICLARALAARPDVLVLDEPTSALDPHSEALIQQSLRELRHELTLFIVAHRMSTLDVCDRVMVILDGRLAAFDTVERLRAHNAYYRAAIRLAAGVPAATAAGVEGAAPAEIAASSGTTAPTETAAPAETTVGAGTAAPAGVDPAVKNPGAMSPGAIAPGPAMT